MRNRTWGDVTAPETAEGRREGGGGVVSARETWGLQSCSNKVLTLTSRRTGALSCPPPPPPTPSIYPPPPLPVLSHSSSLPPPPSLPPAFSLCQITAPSSHSTPAKGKELPHPAPHTCQGPGTERAIRGNVKQRAASACIGAPCHSAHLQFRETNNGRNIWFSAVKWKSPPDRKSVV